MKLRRSFSPHQLLFAALATLLMGVSGYAQERITFRDGRTQEGKILGVTNGAVQFQVGAGTIGHPLANIHSIQMNAPAEFAQAVTAYNAGDYPKAAGLLKPIVDKFMGLPLVWAQQASGMLGSVYVELNQLPEAEKAFTNFKAAYGGAGGSIQSDVGMARIAISKKEYEAARKLLTPITEQMLNEPNPNPSLALAGSQSFFLMGQIDEAEGNHSQALENYLRTVTLFAQDKNAVKQAQERADTLRKEHNVSVP